MQLGDQTIWPFPTSEIPPAAMNSFVSLTREQLSTSVQLSAQLCHFKPSKVPLAVFRQFHACKRRFLDEEMSVAFNHDILSRDSVHLRADFYQPGAKNSTEGYCVVLAVTLGESTSTANRLAPAKISTLV